LWIPYLGEPTFSVAGLSRLVDRFVVQPH
jgi:hypothetical protein